MRILLVEDEPELAAALRMALGQRDMLLDHVATLAEGEEAIIAGVHSAVLLDRNLSDGDGLRLLPHIRARKTAVPVIVLTALGETDDRIEGLDAGADDYLPKPFAIDELLARLRAPPGSPSACRAGNCSRSRACCGGKGVSSSALPWRRQSMASMTRSSRTPSTCISRGCAED